MIQNLKKYKGIIFDLDGVIVSTDNCHFESWKKWQMKKEYTLTALILKQTGYGKAFDAVADGNDIQNSKPAPDVFLKVAERLSLEPSQCMVVEDSDAGVEAALNAGMDVLAVGFASKNKKATYSAKTLLHIKN